MFKYLIIVLVIIIFYGCERNSRLIYYYFTDDELGWIYWDTLNLKDKKNEWSEYYLKYIVNGKDTISVHFSTNLYKSIDGDYYIEKGNLYSQTNIDSFPFNFNIDIYRNEKFDFSGSCNYNNLKTNHRSIVHLNIEKSQIATINVQGKNYYNVYKWVEIGYYYKDTIVLYIAPQYGFLKGTINTNETIVEQIRN